MSDFLIDDDDLEKTLNKIRQSKIPIAKIATDNNVNKRWLADVVNRDIKNPGYKQMRRIERYINTHIKSMANVINIKQAI